MLGDFTKIIRIMRQKTVPSCLKVPPNILPMNYLFYKLPQHSQLSPTQIHCRHIFSVFLCYAIGDHFIIRNKLKKRCVQRIRQQGKSVPVSTTPIHWAVDCVISSKWEIFWKPLLKSLITYGEVSGPSGGWLLSWTALIIPEHQHTEGIPPRLHSLKLILSWNRKKLGSSWKGNAWRGISKNSDKSKRQRNSTCKWQHCSRLICNISKSQYSKANLCVATI